LDRIDPRRSRALSCVAAEPRGRLHVVEFVMYGGTRDVKHPLLSRLPRPVLSTWLKVIRYFGSSFVALIKLYPLYIGTHNTEKLSLRHL